MKTWKRPRIALYSHDTLGLGHIRRNILIAHALSASTLQPDILLASGALEATRFPLPRGTDRLVLPALCKHPDGQYGSRRLQMTLPEIIHLRRYILRATLSAFNPDILIVDNVACGANMELDATLAYLRAKGDCRIILGLRDILDEPAAVAVEWAKTRRFETIRSYFDEIWIYGDPAVYNPVEVYQFPPDIAAKVYFTGYLDQKKRLDFFLPETQDNSSGYFNLPDHPFVFCTLGGGQDGTRLGEAFVSALPSGTNGILLTGPHMDPKAQSRLLLRALNHANLQVMDFLPEPAQWLEHADCVVAMGGYNSVSEILAFGKPALIVPRVSPRKEQLIRAERLQEMGLLDMMHPDDLNEAYLQRWIGKHMGQPPRDLRDKIKLNGLDRIRNRFEEIAGHPNESVSGHIVPVIFFADTAKEIKKCPASPMS